VAWITIEEATSYFADLLTSAKWASVSNKSGAINSAFNILITHPSYVFPDTPDENMSKANAEYALYLATSDPKRQNLIEQGVKSFRVGNFSETLKDTDQGYGTNIILPSLVKQLLNKYEVPPFLKGHFSRPYRR